MSWKVVPYILSIACIIGAPAAYFATYSVQASTILLISGAMLGIFYRLNDLTELSLGGFKAKLEKTLNETLATIQQVKELAKISSLSSLYNTGRSGFWGGLSVDQKQEVFSKTVTVLKNLGVENVEIEGVTKDFHDCVLVSYRSLLFGHQIPENASQECHNQWSSFRGCPFSPAITPNRMRSFFENHIEMDSNLERLLDDYEFYYKNHAFKDIEEYKMDCEVAQKATHRLTAKKV